LPRQRRDIHAHYSSVAPAALEVFELLVDRGDVLAGEVRESRVGTDAARSVAVVARRRERGTASSVAPREERARCSSPCDVRGRLTFATHGSLRGADRYADRSADGRPEIDWCTGLCRWK